MSESTNKPSRRRFLVWLGGVSVGTFLMPGEFPAAVGVPSNVDVGDFLIDELPPDQLHLQLSSLPEWRIAVGPTGDTSDALIYHLEGQQGYQMWWAEDDAELREMRRFYEATRTPGRPNVDPETIFPIERCEEERRLIRAIVNDLRSNEPRLAYADWLEQQGDARGEFVRLQCTAQDTAQREQELLDQYGRSWLLPLAALGIWPNRGLQFTPDLFYFRGMVQSVWVYRENVLPDQAERLWDAAPALGQLLLAVHVDLPGLAALKQMQQVHELCLLREWKPDVETGMAALAESPNLGGLRALAISFDLSDRAIAILSQSSLLARLKGLHLSKCMLSASAVTMLAGSPKIAGVTQLELGHVDPLDMVAARRLAESPYLRQLESLSMGVNDVGPYRMDIAGDALQTMLSGDWSNLKELDLEACCIDDEGAKIIANAPSLTNLTQLGLDNTDITDEGVQAIVDSPYLNSLRSIKVPHSEEMGPKLLARLKRNYGIEDEE